MISNSSVVSQDLIAKIKIEEIKIGKRFRNEIGDISGLVESIKNNGLLCPITVTKDGLLIAELRRIEAHKKLGIEYIPSHVVDILLREKQVQNHKKIFSEEGVSKLILSPSTSNHFFEVCDDQTCQTYRSANGCNLGRVYVYTKINHNVRLGDKTLITKFDGIAIPQSISGGLFNEPCHTGRIEETYNNSMEDCYNRKSKVIIERSNRNG